MYLGCPLDRIGSAGQPVPIITGTTATMDRTARLIDVVQTHPETLATAAPDMLRAMATILETAANDPARDDAGAFIARLSLEDTVRDIRQALPALPRLAAYVERHGGTMPTAAVVAAIESGNSWETVLYAMRKTKYTLYRKSHPSYEGLRWMKSDEPDEDRVWINIRYIAAALGRRGGECFGWLRESDQDKTEMLFGTQVDAGEWWYDYFAAGMDEGRRDEDTLADELAAVYNMDRGEVVRLAPHAARGGYVRILAQMASLDNSMAPILYTMAIRGDRVNVLEYMRTTGNDFFFERIGEATARKGIEEALKMRQHAVVKWLVKYTAGKANLNTLFALDIALGAGDTVMAEWLYEHDVGRRNAQMTVSPAFGANVTALECMDVLEWLKRHQLALNPESTLSSLRLLSHDHFLPVVRFLYGRGVAILPAHEDRRGFLGIVAQSERPAILRWLIEEAGFRPLLSFYLVLYTVAEPRQVYMRSLEYLLSQHCPVNRECVNTANWNGHKAAAAKIQAAMDAQGESFV